MMWEVHLAVVRDILPRMSKLPKVGFVGVGTIVEALITGMCALGEQRAQFLLSPRNAVIANRLAERFPFVAVAADNQAVLDGSDIIFLGVTPQVAVDVLTALKFRPDHLVVSLISTFDVARLRSFVTPAKTIARATPLPAVARRMGALLLYPPVAEVATLLEGLGQLVQLESEAHLDAFWTATCLMSSYFGLLDEVASWLRRQDLEDAAVRPVVAAMFHSLAATAQARGMDGFDKLIAEHSTPGGLNEQAYRELKAAGWTALISQTLDLIHARIGGRATFADRLPVNYVGLGVRDE
jgi:pyrroline-5-carboxylate reductase